MRLGVLGVGFGVELRLLRRRFRRSPFDEAENSAERVRDRFRQTAEETARHAFGVFETGVSVSGYFRLRRNIWSRCRGLWCVFQSRRVGRYPLSGQLLRVPFPRRFWHGRCGFGGGDRRLDEPRFPLRVVGVAVVDGCLGFRREIGARLELPHDFGQRLRRFEVVIPPVMLVPCHIAVRVAQAVVAPSCAGPRFGGVVGLAGLALGLPCALLHLGFRHARQGRAVDIGHALAQVGRLDTEPPRQAVIVAGAVDDDKIAPVAARENIALALERRLEALPVVGAAARAPRSSALTVSGSMPVSRARNVSCFFGRRSGRSKSRSRRQDAAAALEIEVDLELARGALVNGRGERVRNRHHALGIDARPDDVPVRAALLFVLDDEARLAGEAEIFLERIDRLAPLRGRQRARRRAG